MNARTCILLSCVGLFVLGGCGEERDTPSRSAGGVSGAGGAHTSGGEFSGAPAVSGSSSGGRAEGGGGGSAAGTAGIAAGGASVAGSRSDGGSGGSTTGGTAGSGANAGGGGDAPDGAAGNRGGSSGAGGTGTPLAGQGGVSGASGGAGGASTYRPCPTDGTACKILPFGDSITDGFGTAGAYRVELFRLAHQAGKNITFVGTGSNGPPMVDGVAFPPRHEGHSGFTIAPTPSRSGISPLVSNVMRQFQPHIVLLMIGTNDAIDDYQLTNAPMRLGALIDSIYAELPSVLLVVAQPIPSQDDALNGRLRTYNAALPALVSARAEAGRHIQLVDMYTPFAAVSGYKQSLLKDTWHPNETGAALIGARWYAALQPSL